MNKLKQEMENGNQGLFLSYLESVFSYKTWNIWK